MTKECRNAEGERYQESGLVEDVKENSLEYTHEAHVLPEPEPVLCVLSSSSLWKEKSKSEGVLC